MRLTDVAPPACSGCYLSQPDVRHVDFEVAWDGPMFPDGVMQGDGETTTGVAVSIDDLIVCERCLRAAAALVDMTDPGETLAELEQLRDANQNMAERLRGMDDYIANLEKAISSKPEPRTRQPRAKVAG